MEMFGFTPTEQRVAWRLLGDMTNRVIGAALGITEHTVKQHLSVMYQKAQVSSRVGLVLAILVGIATIGLGALRHGALGPLVLGSAGIALMASAIAVGHGLPEAVLTIAGVALVALAHMSNLRHAA